MALIMYQQTKPSDLVDVVAVDFDIVDGLGSGVERNGKNRRGAVLTAEGFAAVRIVGRPVVAARNFAAVRIVGITVLTAEGFAAVRIVGDAVLIGKGFARLERTERHPVLPILRPDRVNRRAFQRLHLDQPQGFQLGQFLWRKAQQVGGINACGLAQFGI